MRYDLCAFGNGGVFFIRDKLTQKTTRFNFSIEDAFRESIVSGFVLSYDMIGNSKMQKVLASYETIEEFPEELLL